MEVVDIKDETWPSNSVEIKLEDIEPNTENPSEPMLKFHLKTQKYPNPTSIQRPSNSIEIKLEDVESDMENPSDSILKFDLKTQRPLNPTSIRHRQENSRDDGEFQYMCNTNEEVQVISCHGNVEEENNPRELINEVQKTVDSTLNQTVELVQPLSELAVGSNNEKAHNDKIDDGKCVREETAEKTVNKSQPDGETNQNKYFFDLQVHPDEYTYSTNEYGCTHCLYLTLSWQDINHHIRLHHRDPSIKKHNKRKGLKQCPHCPKKAIRIAEHIYHCHTESAAINWLVCDDCDYKTKTKQSLLHHVQRKHTEHSEFKCEECGKDFKVRRQLTMHIKNIHKPETLPLLTCDSCNYTTRHRTCFERHMLLHKRPEGGFVCKKCDFRTQNFNKLRIHKKKEHSDWEQCHLCTYRTISKHTLNLHLIHHQDKKKEEDLIYKCDKCRYKTYRAYNLQMHKLSHKKPEEIDMFRCYHCDFKAKRKDNLKTHIFKHDIYKNIFGCYVCTYKTSSNYELKKHIDVHSENQRRAEVELRKLANGNSQVDENEDKNEENVTEQRKKVKNTKTSMDVKVESREKLKRSCKKLDASKDKFTNHTMVMVNDTNTIMHGKATGNS